MRLSTPIAVLVLTFCTLLDLAAQSVRVVFVSGQASIQRPEEPALRPAVKGETVIIGTRIVTGADGRLVLTPMPGIKSIITPNTTLLLEGASETRTSDTNVTQKVVLDLKEGSVVSDLQKPEGVTYDYSIRTARGLAGARGTTYTVGINAAGIQTIVVAHGAISINFSDGRKMTLSPGQLTVTKANGQTQKVEKLEQLSPEDRKVAQKGAETTIAAIATAIDAGISVAPQALNNALAAAKDLGVTISPETQKAVSGALDTSDAPPPEKQPGDAPPAGEPKPGEPKPSDPKPDDPKPPVDPKPPILPPTPPPPPPPPPIITEITAKSAFSLFLERLPATEQPEFLALPGDIQNLLVALNDIDIAVFALKPDPETGLAYTNNDLRTHLAAFNDLKKSNPGAFLMVKEMAGPGLVNISSAPDPLQWSAGAFARTLASWNALTATERAFIIDLGAGDAIMDTSPAYIQALLAQASGIGGLIRDLGWGPHLTYLVANPTPGSIFTALSNLSAAEKSVIAQFDINPKRLIDRSSAISLNADALNVISALAAATVSDAERLLMKQLGVGQRMINQFGTPPFSNATIISNTVTFYNQLTAAEQSAARALNLSDLFYENVHSAIFGSSSRTYLQRAQDLTAFYNAHPALQQSLQDSRILSYKELPIDFVNASAGSHQSILDTLALYNGLPARTRAYLDAANPGDDYNFYELANPSVSASPTNLRPLAEINMLLAGLTNAQFASLIDLDLDKAIIGGLAPSGFVELLNTTDRVADLIATITTYDNLPALHKQVLRELGIIGDHGVSIIGADAQGLDRLLTAYGALPGALRATTERLDESAVDLPSIGSSFGTTAGPAVPQSFFFTAGDIIPVTLHKVRFASAGDLHVGATRFLMIDGSFWSAAATFTVGSNHDLYLHAADLIDLTSTNFSNGIRSITMSAATINLTNINFPNGSVAALNSKLGGVTFDGSRTVGRVNFSNVSYNGTVLGSTADLSDPAKAAGNIRIGSFAAPVAPPAYTAPVAP
jgi:hypothetical protein